MTDTRRFCTLRLYPTKAQQDLFVRTAGCCRKVWNLALDRHDRLGADRFELNSAMRALTAWKRDPGTAYLADAVAQALQQSLRDLARAFANHRTNPGHFDKPRFKRKRFECGFRLPQGWRLDPSSRRVWVPKAGWVRYRGSVHIDGETKSLTVKRDAAGRWHASIQVRVDMPDPVPDPRDPVGLDRGVASLAALSDGTTYPGVRALAALESRIAAEQRRLSRKVGSAKGERKSRNWVKQNRKVSRLRAKAAAIRHDTLHKVSSDVAKNHGYVAVEDLDVKGMTAKGRGRGKSAKSGLNKAILDQGWGAFCLMLEYKLAERGGTLVKVSAAYTSQQCSACGHTAKANRPTRDTFRCERCGHTEDADVNAAKNILARAGQARIACEVNGEFIPSAAGTAKGGRAAA